MVVGTLGRWLLNGPRDDSRSTFLSVLNDDSVMRGATLSQCEAV